MRKKKTASYIEYEQKKQARLKYATLRSPNGHSKILEPTRKNLNGNGLSMVVKVVEDLSPRDLSHQTFNWKGDEVVHLVKKEGRFLLCQ